MNHLQLNLPGFRPRKGGNSPGKSPGPQAKGARDTDSKNVPEEILHQQRLLLQSCDRLKLTVTRHTSQNTNDIVDVITQLGATFTKLIELMLSKEIKVCLISRGFFFNSPHSRTGFLGKGALSVTPVHDYCCTSFFYFSSRVWTAWKTLKLTQY